VPDDDERRARVTVPTSAAALELAPEGRLTFGRDSANVLCFPDDPRLSRHAGELRWSEEGLVVANVSRTHSLFVRSDTGSAELEPRVPHGLAAVFVVRRGRATISVPWPGSSCQVSVDVVAPRSTEGSVVTDGPEFDPPSDSTLQPVHLNASTKLFATALLLCRDRLTAEPGRTPTTPTVPELTRALLEATASFHLLRDLDREVGLRERLQARVHDQLRELRTKLVRHGLAGRDVALSPGLLAEMLVRNRVITRAHLRLLDDDDWQADQAQRWWT
jgi:hypothetical protein